MEVLEFARGLQVRATSFVGRISLGEVTVTVHPKIAGAPLLSLFRYAYGLRDLDTYGPVDFTSSAYTFLDLLILQLAEEVAELFERGLHREYERRRADLASPRGKIDFARYGCIAHGAETTLPCIHYPRSEDTLLNRVLLAGLASAARLATDVDLKGRVERLAKLLRVTVSTRPLHLQVMAEGWNAIDRRTTAYEPAFKLIELLLRGEGVTLDGQISPIRLNGFLFDMNLFFQALVSRFLHEHLAGVDVRDEVRLKGMFMYEPQHNPLGRGDPVLRPDFMLLDGTRTLAILDAKYRDLWEQPLPREMLYQLALYALGCADTNRVAVIIYPTLGDAAREQWITVQEPSSGAQQARIALRAVNLLGFERLLREGRPGVSRRIALAQQLAWGERVNLARDHAAAAA